MPCTVLASISLSLRPFSTLTSSRRSLRSLKYLDRELDLVWRKRCQAKDSSIARSWLPIRSGLETRREQKTCDTPPGATDATYESILAAASTVRTRRGQGAFSHISSKPGMICFVDGKSSLAGTQPLYFAVTLRPRLKIFTTAGINQNNRIAREVHLCSLSECPKI